MKVFWIAALSLGIAVIAATAGAEPPRELQTTTQQRSYALGMDLGSQLRAQSVDIDPALFARGLADAIAGGSTLMTEADAKVLIAQLQAELRARQAAAAIDPKKAEENKKAGEAFLAENTHKPGVVTLPSGLQYKVLTEGKGPKPTASDVVVCHYRGTLIDGTEFDSSYARKEPITVPVKGVIAGWTQALQLMPVGSKWQVFIPAALAYGERGAGGAVGPNATLVFEIELLSIK